MTIQPIPTISLRAKDEKYSTRLSKPNMGLSKIFLALVCVLGSALLQSTHAQDTQQDYLTAHNIARAAVNVGPLSWDEELAGYAQDYANQHIGDCSLVHSGGPYGENLAMSTGDLSGTDAVNMWVAEKADYNYNSNSCADGKVCGHYTQVVWSNTARVGCAKVRCNSGGTFIGCNYDPPGNYVGQKPYNSSYAIILPCARCMDAPIIFTIDDNSEQDSPQDYLNAEQDSPQAYLNAHNAARALVGVAPLTWDPNLVAYAQRYANSRAGDCNLVHSGGPYGENIAKSSGDLSGTAAVNLFVGEKPNYDYNYNTCAAGKVCGHYTQVVWRNSVRLGCAKARCTNGGTFIGCNYDPRGNIVGQKPY